MAITSLFGLKAQEPLFHLLRFFFLSFFCPFDLCAGFGQIQICPVHVAECLSLEKLLVLFGNISYFVIKVLKRTAGAVGCVIQHKPQSNLFKVSAS